MQTVRVQVEQADGWYVAQGLEDTAVITQGRSLDEIVANVREVMALLHDEKAVQIELILPPGVSKGQRSRRASGTRKRAGRASTSRSVA